MHPRTDLSKFGLTNYPHSTTPWVNDSARRTPVAKASNFIRRYGREVRTSSTSSSWRVVNSQRLKHRAEYVADVGSDTKSDLGYFFFSIR